MKKRSGIMPVQVPLTKTIRDALCIRSYKEVIDIKDFRHWGFEHPYASGNVSPTCFVPPEDKPSILHIGDFVFAMSLSNLGSFRIKAVPITEMDFFCKTIGIESKVGVMAKLIES